jgi:hypothetical protein
MEMKMMMMMVRVVFKGGIQKMQKMVIYDRNLQKTFVYACKTTSGTFFSKWVDLENLETRLLITSIAITINSETKKYVVCKNCKSSEQNQS